MSTKLITATTAMLLIFQLANAQTRIYEKVYISGNTTVYKDIPVSYTVTIEPGQTVEIVKKAKFGATEYETKQSMSHGTYTKSEMRTVKSTEMEGYCNFIIKEKESDKVFIDYWYYAPVDVSDKKVQFRDYQYTSAGSDQEVYNNPKDSIKWESFTNCKLENVYHYTGAQPVLAPWKIMIEREYRVLNKDGKYDYYYYFGQGSSKYYLNASDDQQDKFSTQSIDIGALVVPIKLRFAPSGANTPSAEGQSGHLPIRNEVTNDVSIGITIDYSWGKNSFRKDGKETIKLKNSSWSTGLVFSFSGVTLDSTATRRYPGLMRKDEKAGILIFSYGAQLKYSVRNVNAMIIIGRDRGVGQYSSFWNYQNAWWIGLGLGYDIGSFWKKS